MGYLWTIILSLAICLDCHGQGLTQSELGFGGAVTISAGDLFLIVPQGSNITANLIGASSPGGYYFSFNSTPIQGYLTNFNTTTGAFTYQSQTTNSENFTYLVHSTKSYQVVQGNVFTIPVNTNSATNCFAVTNYALVNQTTNNLSATCSPQSVCYTLVTGGQLCVQQEVCSAASGFINSTITIGSGLVCTITKSWTALVPMMTSDTTPSGTVSASSNSSTAWKGIAGNPYWLCPPAAPGWWQYQFPSSHTVYEYSWSSTSGRYDYQLQGSNDGLTWTTLDAQVNVGVFSGLIASPQPFIYYRLNFINSYGPNITVEQFQLIGI